MNKLRKRFQQIKELALTEAQTCDDFKALAFISEELGELSQDLLENQREHGRLEALDVLIASAAMFFRLGGSDDEIDYRLKRQLRKWKAKLQNII